MKSWTSWPLTLKVAVEYEVEPIRSVCSVEATNTNPISSPIPNLPELEAAIVISDITGVFASIVISFDVNSSWFETANASRPNRPYVHCATTKC